MEVIENPVELHARIRGLRVDGQRIGVVPTMGALHEGHLSLIRAARAECDCVVATIFVNPTQFGPGEDFDKYPRTMDRDLQLSQKAGTDLVFAPSVEEMYGTNRLSKVVVSEITRIFEGASRPTHFDGVTTVVAKLFNITLPDRAYFGQKDYQQQLIIRRMVEDLNFPLEIITCPIVREDDGLAMSSRNRYLSSEQRKQALTLNQTLEKAAAAAAGGKPPAEIESDLNADLAAAEGVDLDYAAVVDTVTLQPVTPDCAAAVALVAGRVGNTRLIDNRVLQFVSRKISLAGV